MTGGANSSKPIYMQHFTKVSLPAAVKITCLCTCRFALVYSCRSVSSQRRDEWQSHLVQICLSAESSQGMKCSIDVEKGPKSRKLDLSRDLILLCEASFYVANDRDVCAWTPTVSKCLFKIACLQHQSRRILTQELFAASTYSIWIIQSFNRAFYSFLLEFQLKGSTNPCPHTNLT